MLRIEQQFDSLVAGGVATNTITVTNTGRTSTNGTITITGELPDGLAFVSSSGSHGATCASVASRVTCTTDASIAAYGSLTVELDLQVSAQPGTDLVTKVDVDSDYLATPAQSGDQAEGEASPDITNTVSVTVAGDVATEPFSAIWLLLFVVGLLSVVVIREARPSRR